MSHLGTCGMSDSFSHINLLIHLTHPLHPLGMNVARLNFSHGDHETHAATLDRLREALASRPGVHVGVMLDTKGPEIRTGFLGSAKTVEYKKGSMVEIVTDYSMPGTFGVFSLALPSPFLPFAILGLLFCFCVSARFLRSQPSMVCCSSHLIIS